MSKAADGLNQQADEAWVAIRDSPMASVYVTELHQVAVEIIDNIERVWALLPTAQPGASFIAVSHEVHQLILRAVTAAARGRALCMDRGRGSKQTVLASKLQHRRASWLRGLLGDIDLSPLQDSQVRNTIEHFDEYLDQAALSAYLGEIALPALMPFDMTLSRRQALDQFNVGGGSPSTYFVRVYVADEERFINCGHEVDVAALHAVGVQIRNRVSALGDFEGREGGSPMLVLTNQSFGRGSPVTGSADSVAERPQPVDDGPAGPSGTT